MTERKRVPVSPQEGGPRRRAVPDSLPASREAAEVAPDAPADGAACDCPVLDPADWDGVESDWSDIAFLKTSTTAVLGVPMGFGSTRAELAGAAARLGATVPEDAMLLLGPGRFRRTLMLEVEGAPAGAKGVERPGGIVYTRLLSAPWGKMQARLDETRDAAREKYGRPPDHLWIWYLTCRVCSADRDFETLFVAHYEHSNE
ncbi:MAG: hypothetical protein HY875_00020 [Chloroflexi bacterium]|nr:hypothetical protein [Chloroflexota bacterium]